jgi:lipid II:glycine glycyltransferase (peptidoglycan interpeptide bridge formation enzyme)
VTAPASSPPDAAPRWAAWDAFVAADPAAGFMQTSWWAAFRVHAGFGHFATILKHRGTVLGGAVVLTYEYAPGCSFYYVPEGPVLPADEEDAAPVFEAILTAIEERRAQTPGIVSHLRIEPRWERLPPFVRGFRGLGRRGDGYSEPRDTLCVDLSLTETGLLAQMKPKGRYNIGIARRYGVGVVEDASDRGLHDFLEIYQATTSRHDLDAKPPDYFAELLATLTTGGHGSLFFAEYGGARLAAALVVFCGRRATYFFGGSVIRDRHVMAPYALHFELMRLAKARRCEWYDLWGVAPADDADHPWQNISVFKRKFGGRELRLVPTLDWVYDDAAYDRYVRSRRR